MMPPSLCNVLLFCIFLLLTSSSSYLSLEIYCPEIYLVFYAPIFYVTLELLSYFILTKSTFQNGQDTCLTTQYCQEFSSDSVSMPIDNKFFRARVGIYKNGLSFLRTTLNASQNNKRLYTTRANVLPDLILVLFCLLVVNVYLRSLKINISSSIGCEVL